MWQRDALLKEREGERGDWWREACKEVGERDIRRDRRSELEERGKTERRRKKERMKRKERL
jgi:hypothetical protein